MRVFVKTAGGLRRARHVVKLACAERERWCGVVVVQRPFRWRGSSTREGSRLGSRGRVAQWYYFVYGVLLVCARHKGLCGVESDGGCQVIKQMYNYNDKERFTRRTRANELFFFWGQPQQSLHNIMFVTNYYNT